MNNLAFLFPGQGSQSQGMLAEFAQQYPNLLKSFEEASEVLGYDMWQLCQSNPEDKLNQTEYTQPAILTASYALWCLWKERGGALPSFYAGHSLGEYTALVCAGALSFKDAVRLVSSRGKLMQASTKGGMVAVVGLDNDAVEVLCRELAHDDVLIPANYNAPGQVVVAGESSAIERVLEQGKSFGAKLVKRVAMSVPSHCSLMQKAADELATELNNVTFNKIEHPVIANFDAKPVSSPEQIKQALISQLSNPVKWTQSIEFLTTQNITTCIECGPGNVLGKLCKRIDKSIEPFSMNDVKSFDSLLEQYGE